MIVSVGIAAAAAAAAHAPLDAAPALPYEMVAEHIPTNPGAPGEEHEDNEVQRTIHHGYIAGSAYRCATLGHGQEDGTCVNMRTPQVNAGPWLPSAYFACPHDYPYPLEGFLSGNPVWDSSSEGAFVSVKAVRSDGGKVRDLSYAGSSPHDPGWIFVTGVGGKSPKIKGSYACSDTPASVK
ncbi:hypothetical protein LQL77_31335 [Rhodococcus cerastii]|nr:hypothetical protein [Rhodococcus cerastii]